MAEARLKVIETRAVLPDGRVVTSYRSKPSGYTIAEYRKIDAALVRAFGSKDSYVSGIYL